MGQASEHFPAYAVVAGGDLNGLGVLRALGMAGVPVVVLDTDLSKPTLATRHGKKFGIRALSGSAFVQDLRNLRSRFESNPVLILTQELSVWTVSEARGALSAAYRFTMPPHSVMQMLLDKTRFQQMAERGNFAVPRAARLTRDSGLQVIGQLRFPCVVKPAAKNPLYDERFAKAYRVSRFEEVEQLWGGMRNVVNEVIVQEWIDGDDADVFFCLQYRKPGTEACSFVGRKTGQWPPLVGGTASCVPAPEAADELTDLTNRFFNYVGFSGLGSMEYKRSAHDGRYYMIEPTVGRTDYQEEIAVLNGTNIPLAAYLGELSLTPSPAKKIGPARGWRDPFGCANARKAGAQPVTVRGVKMSDAYFRLSDPMPYVALMAAAVRRRFTE